ncbi:MAG: hypothetical protein ACI4HQ_12695 [Acetatifactor sp.]
MNYFVEGIQGAGKSTMVGKLAKEYPDYTVFREGDYSPVELAWCAYVGEQEYADILAGYNTLADEIKEKSVQEGDRRIICYTRILTDVPGFHKDLEQYEIYNGRRLRDDFERIVLERFAGWQGENQIFECSIFQNIIENQILYYEMTDEEILEFYRKVKQALLGKKYQIVYLEVEDIQAAEEVIRKERSDEQGRELWFPLMISYLESSPYGKHHKLRGMDGLVKHLENRMKLEKRILAEVFPEHAVIKRR